ncbi:unnamed protein product [Rhizophagus irregularis]|uniref:Uncharacterized protein n=1 Tax=Rhizophagus irregularis TaxID=588596 RepID=A0A2N1M754_9GLOM|nr:hypothetical protein RhiirC2_797971 [Rhizophagus irregularis]CAB4393520.1 unnamed protein product [Rhizophagus irregularis]
MIILFVTFISLIIPNVYAQEYNPTSDTYDNLINSTSKYDFVCMISCIILSTYFVGTFIYVIKNNVIKIIDKPQRRQKLSTNQYIILSLLSIIFGSVVIPTFSFTYAIFWIRKDVIIEKITYEWYIVISTIFILIVFILLLFGRPLLAFYFYLVVSIGLCFSIAYSSNSYFTKLGLVFMTYFLARIFDSEVLLGKFVKSIDESAFVRDLFYVVHRCFSYFAKIDSTRMLRIYIDEAAL